MPKQAGDPRAVAAAIVDAHDDQWVEALAAELVRLRHGKVLTQVMSSWKLSAADLGRTLQVSPRTVSRWLADGGPPLRPQVEGLEQIAMLLQRHVKAARIPIVVRKQSPGLDRESIVSLMEGGRTEDAVRLTHAMFAFGDAMADS